MSKTRWSVDVDTLVAMVRRDEKGQRLRVAKAREMAASGEFSGPKAVLAAMMEAYGTAIGAAEMTAIYRAVAPAPAVAAAPPVAAESDGLGDLRKMHGDIRRLLGFYGALRHEVRRIADTLGAPRDTTEMADLRAGSPIGHSADSNGATKVES